MRTGEPNHHHLGNVVDSTVYCWYMGGYSGQGHSLSCSLVGDGPPVGRGDMARISSKLETMCADEDGLRADSVRK